VDFEAASQLPNGTPFVTSTHPLYPGSGSPKGLSAGGGLNDPKEDEC